MRPVLLFLAFLVAHCSEQAVAPLPRSSKSQCLAHIREMEHLFFRDFALFSRRFSTFWVNSGKYVMDMGSYHACEMSPDYTYTSLVYFVNRDNPVVVFGLGLCLNASCDAAALTQMKHEIVEFLVAIGSLVIPNPPISESNLEFHPLDQPPSPVSDAGFWLTLLALLALLLPLPVLIYRKVRLRYCAPCKQPSALQLAQPQPNATSSQPLLDKPAPLLNEEPRSEEAGGRGRAGSVWRRVEQCFSLELNFKKFCTLRSSNNDLLVFNGIRFICFMEIIFGHVYEYSLNYASEPLHWLKDGSTTALFNEIYSTFYAVDAFFFLSGFFVTYTTLDAKRIRHLKFHKPLSLLLAILHRLIRLWPALIVVIFFFWKISGYFVTGPNTQIHFYYLSYCDTKTG